MVRRVLPPTDPLGAAGGPLPVCETCAARLDGMGDLAAPARETAGRLVLGAAASSGAGFLLLAVMGLLFLGALIAFLHENGR